MRILRSCAFALLSVAPACSSTTPPVGPPDASDGGCPATNPGCPSTFCDPDIPAMCVNGQWTCRAPMQCSDDGSVSDGGACGCSAYELCVETLPADGGAPDATVDAGPFDFDAAPPPNTSIACQPFPATCLGGTPDCSCVITAGACEGGIVAACDDSAGVRVACAPR